jgi:hypothetical protein
MAAHLRRLVITLAVVASGPGVALVVGLLVGSGRRWLG